MADLFLADPLAPSWPQTVIENADSPVLAADYNLSIG